MARQDQSLTVLHVEDDDSDAILLVKACEQARLPVSVYRMPNAEEARAYLLGEMNYTDRFKFPLPQVIVLDLKLPGCDGCEFLEWLRTQESFAKIPVLVFTASILAADKVRAEAAGANSYFVKPVSFEAWVKLVEVFKTPEQSN